MTLTSKFKKDLQTLKGAANRETYLDVKNAKLFKKVRRFYEKEGIEFTGDGLEDYEILIDCIAGDLASVEAS